MWIKNLLVKNCRILQDVSIELSEGFNLILGENASGKSSFVEALSLLSNGRSFRTSHISDVIRHDEGSVLISAEIFNDQIRHRIGIEKFSDKTKIRIDQTDIYSQSTLSSFLPLITIHPGSIDLIVGTPSQRRSFIDWIAFYSFDEFHSIWKEYQHILKQRNLCLKDSKHRYALNDWTAELIRLQPEITKFRLKSIKLLESRLDKISTSLLDGKAIKIQYKTGFPQDLAIEVDQLKEFYKDKQDQDIKSNRTSGGVHRADIVILLDGNKAKESASRGQLKLLAISLLLAQSQSLDFEHNKKAILAIDDLAAELDKYNMQKLLLFLSSLEQQIIITSTKPLDIVDSDYKMFHVKHGKLEQIES